MEISIALTVSSFIAGLLMFLAPCTLPLVPAYLAFISGVTQKEAQENRSARKRIVTNAFMFVFGFSVVFVLFGVLAGLLGSQIGQYRSLMSQIGGGFVIIFGLMMLNLVSIPLLRRELKFPLPKTLSPGHPSSALLIGAIFALGWTPCVGPVLASVLLLATTNSTALQGAILLAIFSLGLAIPFVATALVYARAESTIVRISRLGTWFTRIGGIFLILIGTLLLTENFELTIIYGYKVFQFFNIEAFYDHL